jgi:4-amino-4-deoxy-L-arabinose transferase-like glycosyltransferase
MVPRYWTRAVLALASTFILFFYGLSNIGLLGPDEPRYASIGRAMAASGDWITPRLDGDPWFEKPALLYWMAGAGFVMRLGNETAPRLPVAVLSVAFLWFYWRKLERWFPRETAWYATVALATSAGWLAFSNLSVTDLPLTVFFAAGMLVALEWIESGDGRRALLAGALFGAAVMAKGLVPLVLAAPLIWFARDRWRQWIHVVVGCLAVAMPWYTAITWMHGRAFIDEFFLKHHFARFSSNSLQHVQPIWFYVPALLGLLFPWTPALFFPVAKSPRRDYFLAWLLWGFVFFSLSQNKLPGYLLPLLPAACVLIGWHLATARRAGLTTALITLLLGPLPVVMIALPYFMGSGVQRPPLSTLPWNLALWAVPMAAAVWWLETQKSRQLAIGMVAICLVSFTVYLKAHVLPEMDSLVSARAMAREVPADPCADRVPRSLRYGLDYYARGPIEPCDEMPGANGIRPIGVKPLKHRPAARFAVSFDAALDDGPVSGRLLVFLTNDAAPQEHVLPDPMRPNRVWIGARDVKNWMPGQSIVVDPTGISFPGPFDRAPGGNYQIMAMFDATHSYAYTARIAGALTSKVLRQTIARPDQDLVIPLRLSRREPLPKIVHDTASIRLVEFASPMLSRFATHPVTIRATVQLPNNFEESGERYPVLYLIHAFGDAHRRGRVWDMYSRLPPYEMVYVFLDATCEYGHHYFADSANNGPWSTALVEEFLPVVEQKFRLENRSRGRFLTGHGSGGWSALALQLQHPGIFGGAWAIAPDPPDFRSFFGVDLTAAPAPNFYRNVAGKRRPLLWWGAQPVLSLEEATWLEHTIGHPGGMIDAFEAAFSPRTSEEHPTFLFDRSSGAIDPVVQRAWLRHDLAAKAPQQRDKLRIIIGSEDTRHLSEQLRLWPGPVEALPGKNQNNMYDDGLAQRVLDEIRKATRYN